MAVRRYTIVKRPDGSGWDCSVEDVGADFVAWHGDGGGPTPVAALLDAEARVGAPAEGTGSPAEEARGEAR
jgi:hypothetical protein